MRAPGQELFLNLYRCLSTVCSHSYGSMGEVNAYRYYSISKALTQLGTTGGWASEMATATTSLLGGRKPRS